MFRSQLYKQSARISFRRPFHGSMAPRAITPFHMPAMSPTMEKGGIVSWKFKVGEPFQAGDVILEVETDKAQIDVEAQDDGKLAAIVKGDGSKDVDVGETVAFLAEVEDDLSALEIPKVVTSEAPKEAEAKPSPKVSEQAPAPARKTPSKTVSNGILQQADKNQTLLPSVITLLHANGVTVEEAFANIKASGPNGRILKGDVLGYLGKISADSVVKVSEYIKKFEHLDLSNIELRPAQPPKGAADKKAEPKPAPPAYRTLHERLILKVPEHVSFERFSNALKQYIREATYTAHGEALDNPYSDHFDPLFEELLSVQPREPRFEVSYDVLPLTVVPSSSKPKEDIFDILSGNSVESKPAPSSSEPSAHEYALDLYLKVENKFSDSETRAARFIDYIKELDLSSH
ncbi:AGR323Cp [Eremothecium gossypii ATCC 10895]|uniref:AGR323Cp n=1 Tax=Eremothecium gossypii (strain ATCC 10895 / CBS 109.51 / FGSC 9923 / NRRL Y-1056) TaxID=284811 RepID=Q74Z83_EREGS|nr:AGR323Cp [Eremothecium gossypii ATCC 10895]AAS54813.2 AGR323Cp [Eremothecium gossypii ATCC 10895]AEY99145.1 FAGR323Cp [Eremothecium gossypii FDAG1]